MNQSYTPHPDYPAEVWTEPEVEAETKAFIDGAPTDAAVLTDGIMEILNRHGYDSIDRELAFWYTSQTKGIDYEALYQRWLHS